MSRLDEWIADWDGLDAEDRLAEVVELADQLPPLSAARGSAPFPGSCRVQECQTAVHLWVDVVDGRVHIEADVPRSSPTVRGLVTLVAQIIEGSAAADVLQLPDDWLPLLGLRDALGMTRQQGLRGVIARIKRDIRQRGGE